MTADPIVLAARFLLEQTTWLAHATEQGQPWAPGAYAEIADCARRLRGIVNGPAERKYLGPCGAILECNPIRCAPDCPPGCGVTEPICDGDVYAVRGASTGRCRTCKAEHDAAQRQAWLDGEVRQRNYTARDIADAYGLNVKTIRSWHARGQLAQHGTEHDPKTGKDSPLHNVGEVLDLAAADALRRHDNQQKRARRQGATGERMSA